MCNIAGYVGEKQAFPILVEMLKRQEGLDCGYYTGIATMHEGKIYYAKMTGNLKDFLAHTDAFAFPGTIGIIHGRTPGRVGEGDSWAHPFVCQKDGEVKTAMILNGAVGAFAKRNKEYVRHAETLLDRGYKLTSRIPGKMSGLNMPDDTSIHMSDILCQIASGHILGGEDTVNAMANAFYEMPKQCVCLLLSLTEPEAITWCRMDMPLHVGFVDHGAYLATTPMAFLEDCGEPVLMPPLSAGLIRKDGFTCQGFKRKPGTVSPLTYQVNATAYQEVCEGLREGRKTLVDITMGAAKWMEPSDCKEGPLRVAIYEILDDLNNQGKLQIEKEYVPGMLENLKAPRIYMTLKE